MIKLKRDVVEIIFRWLTECLDCDEVPFESTKKEFDWIYTKIKNSLEEEKE